MDAERTNTAPEQRKTFGKPFTKGDPRINRKGRPKSFDALRELAQQIAHEPAPSKDGGSVVIGDHVATQAEMILRQMARDNPERFIEIAFGKVPTPIEATIKRIEIGFVHDDAVAAIAAGSVGDSVAPGEGEGDLHGPALGENDDGG